GMHEPTEAEAFRVVAIGNACRAEPTGTAPGARVADDGMCRSARLAQVVALHAEPVRPLRHAWPLYVRGHVSSIDLQRSSADCRRLSANEVEGWCRYSQQIAAGGANGLLRRAGPASSAPRGRAGRLSQGRPCGLQGARAQPPPR